MSAVLHAPVLILFGMHNQFFLLNMGTPFFYSFAVFGGGLPFNNLLPFVSIVYSLIKVGLPQVTFASPFVEIFVQ